MPKSQTTIKKTNKNKTPDDPQIPSQSSKPHELQGTEIRRRVLLCWATRVSSFSEARQATLGSVSSSGMGGHQASPSSGFGAVVFLLRRGEFSVSVINIVLSTGKSGHPAHAVSAVCHRLGAINFLRLSKDLLKVVVSPLPSSAWWLASPLAYGANYPSHKGGLMGGH